MPQKQCPSCGESGYVFQAKCNYCYARKLVYLRIGRTEQAGCMQQALFDKLKPSQKEDVERILKEHFPRKRRRIAVDQ